MIYAIFILHLQSISQGYYQLSSNRMLLDFKIICHNILFNCIIGIYTHKVQVIYQNKKGSLKMELKCWSSKSNVQQQVLSSVL